jgi:hypothetical protein
MEAFLTCSRFGHRSVITCLKFTGKSTSLGLGPLQEPDLRVMSQFYVCLSYLIGGIGSVLRVLLFSVIVLVSGIFYLSVFATSRHEMCYNSPYSTCFAEIEDILISRICQHLSHFSTSQKHVHIITLIGHMQATKQAPQEALEDQCRQELGQIFVHLIPN